MPSRAVLTWPGVTAQAVGLSTAGLGRRGPPQGPLGSAEGLSCRGLQGAT